MFYNIGYTNTVVIYCHCMVISKLIKLYITEWQYYHRMVVNYCSKMLFNIGPRLFWSKTLTKVGSMLIRIGSGLVKKKNVMFVLFS
jgi:hypothetical protein